MNLSSQELVDAIIEPRVRSEPSQSAWSIWMNGIVSLALVVTGLIGNISMMISFHCCGGLKVKDRRRQAFYFYLMTFATWNTGLLVATVLFSCLPTLIAINSHQISASTVNLSSILYLVGYLLGNCCVTADAWLAVVVTVERFLAVSQPLRSRLSSPRRRAKLICTLLSVLAIFYNFPLMFEFTIHYGQRREYEMNMAGIEKVEFSNNFTWGDVQSFLGLTLTQMRDNVIYQLFYRVVANFVFVSFVPFVVVLFLTVRIVCVVRESDRKRSRFRIATHTVDTHPAAVALTSVSSNSTTPSRNYRQTDVILTLIAIKFLLCYTLPIVINIVELAADPRIFEPEDSSAAKTLLFLVDLSNLLVVIDGATNSFFYFSWRNRFTGYRLSRWSNSQRSALMLGSNCALAIGGQQNVTIVTESSRRRSACESARQKVNLKAPEQILRESFELHNSWLTNTEANIRIEEKAFYIPEETS